MSDGQRMSQKDGESCHPAALASHSEALSKPLLSTAEERAAHAGPREVRAWSKRDRQMLVGSIQGRREARVSWAPPGRPRCGGGKNLPRCPAPLGSQTLKVRVPSICHDK